MASQRYYITDNRNPNTAQAVRMGHPHPYLSLSANTALAGGAIEWVEFPIDATPFQNGDEAAGVLIMLPVGCMILNESRTFWAQAQRELGMRR